MGDLSKSESAPSQQFVFKKPVYDSHYLSTHYNHLERHDSIFKEFKHLFKRNSRHGTSKLSDVGSQRSSKSGIGSGSGCVAYSFGNEFNKDLKHHYGKWGKYCDRERFGGSVCVIRRAKDNKVFAVKEFRKREPPESERAYVKKVTAEFCIGSMLHHDNIIETLDIIQEGSSFYQIMEYVPYDMFTIVMNSELSPAEIGCCWRQLLSGVDYLHQVGIGHRDLKLDNLVMDERNIVKIIDFGTATVVRYPYEKEDRLSKGLCGSDPYIAPEQYNQPFYNAFSADLWSCGIIYVCMVLHRFAWYVPRPDRDANYQMYLNNRNSLLAYIPRYARQTIAHLLEPYPPDRCTMPFLLSDPWVASIETCTPHRHYQHHHPLPSSPCTNSNQPFSPV
ncbi:kinase-like domain-containing protein [Absidia repens]|uniref:Kinase-like domain-containing protein n=1 Tax=Absidia repens TaxID=90262 RepID=A0A1X2IFA1_9FUNG|nr:kinase-like domain-containing protein [Absidia repens]